MSARRNRRAGDNNTLCRWLAITISSAATSRGEARDDRRVIRLDNEALIAGRRALNSMVPVPGGRRDSDDITILANDMPWRD